MLSSDTASINPLPVLPILGFSNLAPIKILCQKYGQMGIQLFDKVENIVGKGEIVMSNFSFSRNVFKSFLLLMRQNEYLWSKGLSITVKKSNWRQNSNQGCGNPKFDSSNSGNFSWLVGCIGV